MEAPVVVNPEADSKKALMKEGIVPEKIYGSDPIPERTSHDNVTARYASRLLAFVISTFRLERRSMI
jgi:hypothetical protein